MHDGSEKEIVYALDMCNPELNYTKPLYGKKSRKHIMLYRIMAPFIMSEAIALLVLDDPSSKIWWGLLLLLIISICVKNLFVLPHKRKKYYEKIHAAKEDCYSYIFYDDCVRVKNPVAEVTLKYDTAEYFAEDSERLMIIFPFNRAITIDKKQCGEEKLGFFRNIVPKENQNKTERKTAGRFFVYSSIIVLYALLLAVILLIRININARTYDSDYPPTTCSSFEACLDAGVIKDVVIIQNEYIEYTYTGREEDERYFTVYTGDINQLTEKLEDDNVNWKFE